MLEDAMWSRARIQPACCQEKPSAREPGGTGSLPGTFKRPHPRGPGFPRARLVSVARACARVSASARVWEYVQEA